MTRNVLMRALAVMATIPDDVHRDDRYSLALELMPLYHHPKIGTAYFVDATFTFISYRIRRVNDMMRVFTYYYYFGHSFTF